MKICVFFGQRDCPPKLDKAIYAAAEKLILERRVDLFYLCESGRFETQVRRVLPKLKEAYPHIAWYIVPSMPPEEMLPRYRKEGELIYRPAELDLMPKRFHVAMRNDWLVRVCDIVLCCNPSRMGFAAQYIRKAKDMGKEIVYLE